MASVVRVKVRGLRGPGLSEADEGVLQGYVDAAAEQVALATAEKDAAGDSAALSQAWAEGTEPGGPGTKSAKVHAEDAGDSAVASGLARDEAVAAAATAGNAGAVAAAALFNQLRYASVRFPPENGERATSGENGAIRLVNSDRLTRTSVDYDTPIFPSASDFAIFFPVTIPETYQGLQRTAHILSSNRNVTTARTIAIGFRGGRQGASAADYSVGMRFFASIVGESGTGGAWQVDSAPIVGDGGKFMLALRKISDVLYLDFWDLDTFTKTACPSPTAKPGSWFGVRRFGKDITIGGSDPELFPWPASSYANKTFIPPFRGQIGDILFVDGGATDGQIEDIMAGEDIAATLGSGNIRLHLPLVSAGALDLTTVASNMPAKPVPTLMGKVYPGSTLLRQAADTYLTVDHIPDPGCMARENGARHANMEFKGAIGDQTGALEALEVDEDGRVLKDWYRLADLSSFTGGAWSAWVELPLIGKKAQHIYFRCTSDPDVVARVNTRMLVGASVQTWHQSEGAFSLGEVPNTQWNPGYDTAAIVPFEGDAGRYFFKSSLRGFNKVNFIRHSQYDANFMGDAGVTIANYWARKADEPLFLICQTEGGTSRRALMDDSWPTPSTDRSWSDAIDVASKLIANRSKAGEIVITGEFDPGWNASDAFNDYSNEMLVPWYRGVPTTAVPLAALDHYLYDGTFSLNAKIVVSPISRAASYSTGKVSDRSTLANRRQSYYQAAQMFGAEVAPEWVSYELESMAGGGHAKPKTLTGDIQAALSMAEGICMAAGHGSYRGPCYFTSLAWVPGSGNLEIIATLSGPVSGPLSTRDGTGNATGFEAKLTTGSGPEDGWSKNHVYSVEIIGPWQVKITLASAGTTGQTQITYHSGGGGGYEYSYDATWRAGALLAGEWEVAGSNTPIGTI